MVDKEAEIDLLRELSDLQESFAFTDLYTNNIDPSGFRLLLKKLLDMRLRIDGNKNHGRPHVHVDYGKQYHVASYAIDNGERLAGTLDSKYDRAVIMWIERYRAKLMEAWNLTQAGKDATPIAWELQGK